MGQNIWVIPGGHIPLKSTGREPELLSQDKISILNTNDSDINLRMTVIYSDEEETGTYTLTVKARRVRKFRVNDLIEPAPVELKRDYALIIRASEPVVVQFLRMDTGSEHTALMSTIGFSGDL